MYELLGETNFKLQLIPTPFFLVQECRPELDTAHRNLKVKAVPPLLF